MAARELLHQVGEGQRSRHVAERGLDQPALKRFVEAPVAMPGLFCCWKLAAGAIKTQRLVSKEDL